MVSLISFIPFGISSVTYRTRNQGFTRGQRTIAGSPQAYSSLLPAFVNKVLWEPSFTHIIYGCFYVATTEELWQRLYGPQSLKYLQFGLKSRKKFSKCHNFCSNASGHDRRRSQSVLQWKTELSGKSIWNVFFCFVLFFLGSSSYLS